MQAILRGNLLLPAAGSGATSFAPNNAAFTDMLQTLSAPRPLDPPCRAGVDTSASRWGFTSVRECMWCGIGRVVNRRVWLRRIYSTDTPSRRDLSSSHMQPIRQVLLQTFLWLTNSQRLLPDADLTIVDALNLGDKLQSILYYHFLPQAYNASQLAALGAANTDLGVSTGTPYNLTFGQSPTGQVAIAHAPGCRDRMSSLICRE